MSDDKIKAEKIVDSLVSNKAKSLIDTAMDNAYALGYQAATAEIVQAHYDELLEQCAKLCENQWDVDSAAASIRALKGKYE